MFFEERLKKILVCCIVKVNLVKKKKGFGIRIKINFFIMYIDRYCLWMFKLVFWYILLKFMFKKKFEIKFCGVKFIIVEMWIVLFNFNK